jgi:hypothetical protein
MKQRVLDHLRRMKYPQAMESAWPQEAFPEPQQPITNPQAPQPPPAKGGGGQLNAGALESFLPTQGAEEMNPEAPLDVAGAMQGAPQGRFADRLRRKRMATNSQNQEAKRGGLEWQ